jgi:hypothetical protein
MTDMQEAKSGWGGARPGAGRSRKIKPTVLPEKVYTKDGLRVTPHTVKMPRIHGDITTGGALGHYEHASVYVAVRSDGCVKVGMTTDVHRRCRELGASLFAHWDVNPGLAKFVETLALRKLGHMKSGTEWTACRPETAAEALFAAVTEIGIAASTKKVVDIS